MKSRNPHKELANLDQLKRYAKDLAEVYESEKKKRAELKAANQQLKRYAEDLNKTISDLKASNLKLESLCEINKTVGELSSIEEIVGFTSRKVEEMTPFIPRGMLVFNSNRDGLSLIREEEERFTDTELVEKVVSLKKEEILTGDEIVRLNLMEEWGEDDTYLMVPIVHEGQETVAALLLFLAGASPRREDIQVVSLVLSQTAGAIKRAVRQEEELERLRERLESGGIKGDIVGSHIRILEIHDLIESVADSDATVLIQGESGTGKELVARRIHQLSSREDGPFVSINCAAFPQTLLESELFGHVKGAFTGAVRDKKGCFERADRGTIFLDEIGEIPLTAQVKLLRVLQFHEFQRLGDEKNVKVDIRVLAATSRDLKKEMARGNFREDLYYRLHVIPIVLPPLRERMSDLPLLSEHFIRKFHERTGKEVLGLDQQTLEVLMRYNWPGNIRELENVIEHAFIVSKEGVIKKRDFPISFAGSDLGKTGGHVSLDEHEKRYLIKVLEECDGNKQRASKILKISRSTLYRKLEAYGIK